jgi:hypothetical protein
MSVSPSLNEWRFLQMLHSKYAEAAATTGVSKLPQSQKFMNADTIYTECIFKFEYMTRRLVGMQTQAILVHHFPYNLACMIHQYILPRDISNGELIYAGHYELCMNIYDANPYIIDFALIASCVMGHIDIAQLLITRGASDFNDGLCAACAQSHYELVLLMLDHNANPLAGFKFACSSGNRKIVDLITKLINVNDIPKNILDAACQGGNREIVDLMISYGADDWNHGLYGACMYGSRDLIDLMISYGANDWNLGLKGACKKGHIESINYMILRGANDFSGGLSIACSAGHVDVANLLITKYKCIVTDFDAWTACIHDRHELAALLISFGLHCKCDRPELHANPKNKNITPIKWAWE